MASSGIKELVYKKLNNFDFDLEELQCPGGGFNFQFKSPIAELGIDTGDYLIKVSELFSAEQNNLAKP